jgi:hypothetical protein
MDGRGSNLMERFPVANVAVVRREVRKRAVVVERSFMVWKWRG